MAIVGDQPDRHVPGLQLALVDRRIFFYRAFTLTFAGADHRRYALMLFFLPSLIFWTADVSKESLMMLSLGLVAYGGAKIFTRQRGGFMLLIPGVTLGYYVRPNELLLVLSGFAVAMMLPTAGGPAEPGRAPALLQPRRALRASCSSRST